MQKFIRRASFAVAAKIFAQGMSLLLLAITTRLLGAEGQGVIAVSTTWVMLFVTIGHFSLGQVAQHYAATSQSEKWLDDVLGNLLSITVVVSVAVWALSALMYFVSEGRIFGNIPLHTFLLALLLVPFMLWEVYGSALLITIDHIEIYNRAQIIGKLLAIVFVFVFVWSMKLGVNGAILAIVLSQAFISMFGIKFLFSQVSTKICWLETKIVRMLLAGGGKLHLNAIGAFLFSSVNVLIIQYYNGPAEAGYYQVATQLVMALFLIPQTLTQLLYGKLTVGGANGIWPYQKKIMAATLLLMTVVGLLMGIMADTLIHWVASDSFASSAEIMRVYLLVLIAGTVNTMMGVQWIARGLFLQSAMLTIITGLFNFILNMILVPNYGALGAAWATVIGAYLIPFSVNVIFVNKINRSHC